MSAVEYRLRPRVRRRDAQFLAILPLFPLIVCGVGVGTTRHTSLPVLLGLAFGVPLLLSGLAFGYQLLASRGDGLRLDGTGLLIRQRWRTHPVAWTQLERLTVVPHEGGGESLMGWLRAGVLAPALGVRSGRQPPVVPGAVELYRLDALAAGPAEIHRELARFAGPVWQPPAR
jgi:hypothetical protein